MDVAHNPRMHILRRLCPLVFLFCAFLAQAHDFVSERSWVEDPNGSMTLAEVQQAPQHPFTGKVFGQGFSQSTYWIRLRIDPGLSLKQTNTDNLVIRIRPPFQDQIWLYDPLAKRDQAQATGDFFDWEQDEYRSLNLNLLVPLGAQPRDVWLKLKTTSSTMTLIEVVSEDEARALDRRQEMLSMLYLACMVVFLGWGILAWVNKKDSLVALYILRQIMAILYALVVLGYGRIFASGWLSGQQLDILSVIIIWVFVNVVIWFDSRLLSEFKPNRWCLRLFQLLLLVLPLELLFLALGQLRLSVLINSLMILPAIALAFVCALTTKAWAETRHLPPEQRPLVSKTFLVMVYGALVLILLLNRLPVMGVTDAQENFLYFNLVYPFTTSLTLMILVQTRLYRQSKRQEEAQRRLALAELETEKERAQRIEQSNFLKMLAHEMKTPLSVVRMAVGSERPSPRINDMADRAVRDMNGIIERLLQVEKLHDDQLSIQPATFNLVDMVHHLKEGLPFADRLVIESTAALVMESDARFVQIILSNLIDNAQKYGAANQPVRVQIAECQNVIRIEIINQIGNAGVPDPLKVFDKYYRAPGAHERTGSGLGLYLTKALVDLLGGHINCRNENTLVCFVLTLPKKPS